ncbi:hypothetical protein EXS65_03835, partial [Candidatus Peribacteria bacterium]|nr:hypothetical protein [Candidatus Peribacteria bacterium]
MYYHFDVVLSVADKIKEEDGLMQNELETSSAENLSPEAEAASLINEVTTAETQGRKAITPVELATRIEIAAALRPEGTQEFVHTYTTGLQEDLEPDAQITDLQEGVGGQTDGNTIEIATDT